MSKWWKSLLTRNLDSELKRKHFALVIVKESIIADKIKEDEIRGLENQIRGLKTKIRTWKKIQNLQMRIMENEEKIRKNEEKMKQCRHQHD